MVRFVFYILFGLNVAATVLIRLAQPGRIAVHFGAGGRADRWASADENALLVLGLLVFMFALCEFSHRVIFVCPPSWVSLPHKDYWLSPERRAETGARLLRLMRVFGCVWFLFWLGLQALSYQANRSDPVQLSTPLFCVLFGVFMLAVVVWCVALILSFRPPVNENAAD